MIAHSHVLDMIEPVRPVIDAKILFMLKYYTLDPADFIIRKDGVCRLSPQFARMVAGLVMPVTSVFRSESHLSAGFCLQTREPSGGKRLNIGCTPTC